MNDRNESEVFTFGAKEGRGHEELQTWRRANARGYILQIKAKSQSILHSAHSCPHLGDSIWAEGRPGWGTLGHTLKACSNSEESLRQWLISEKKQNGDYRRCQSCSPGGVS